MLQKLCVILAILTVAFSSEETSFTTVVSNEACKTDLIRNSSICYQNCPFGSFALPGMTSCHKWLDCNDDIIILSLISASVVKTVYLADWKGYKVVISVLSSDLYEEDFLHNLYMLRLLSPNKLVINLLGYCGNSILTEYYELGNALNTHYHLANSFKAYDNLKTRFNFCISYVSIIQLLHNASSGVRVMCDSNTLEKTLSQFLVGVDLQLVVNDLDATPVVDIARGGVHCGSKELIGEFIAPEQAWPYAIEFDKNKMPLYDEKTDIFKIPDVCNWFLGESSDVEVVKYKLFEVHKNCKSVDPCKRPSADFIMDVYMSVFDAIM